jgi:hypothetical protein
MKEAIERFQQSDMGWPEFVASSHTSRERQAAFRLGDWPAKSLGGVNLFWFSVKWKRRLAG